MKIIRRRDEYSRRVKVSRVETRRWHDQAHCWFHNLRLPSTDCVEYLHHKEPNNWTEFSNGSQVKFVHLGRVVHEADCFNIKTGELTSFLGCWW
jgi:hypothetical protein